MAVAAALVVADTDAVEEEEEVDANVAHELDREVVDNEDVSLKEVQNEVHEKAGDSVELSARTVSTWRAPVEAEALQMRVAENDEMFENLRAGEEKTADCVESWRPTIPWEGELSSSPQRAAEGMATKLMIGQSDSGDESLGAPKPTAVHLHHCCWPVETAEEEAVATTWSPSLETRKQCDNERIPVAWNSSSAFLRVIDSYP